MKWWYFLFISITSLALAALHRPEAFLKKLNHDAYAGKAIALQFCAVCHAATPQIALGAPRIGYKQDWQVRLKQYGLDGLLKHTQEGMGAMPPRGGCFECSDLQLKAAIEYMIQDMTPSPSS